MLCERNLLIIHIYFIFFPLIFKYMKRSCECIKNILGLLCFCHVRVRLCNFANHIARKQITNLLQHLSSFRVLLVLYAICNLNIYSYICFLAHNSYVITPILPNPPQHIYIWCIISIASGVIRVTNQHHISYDSNRAQ